MADNGGFGINVEDTVYYRFSMMYLQYFPKNIRKALDFISLIVAVVVFYEFTNFHKSLANPANCLDHVIDIWPKNGILRVEIIQSYKRYPEQNGIINEFRTEENSYEREYRLENVLCIRNKNFSLFIDSTKVNSKNKEEVDIEPSTVELVENKFRETSTPKPNFDSESLTNNVNVEDEKEKMSIPPATEVYWESKVVRYTSPQVLHYLRTKKTTKVFFGQVKKRSRRRPVFCRNVVRKHPFSPPLRIFYDNYIVEYSLNDENLFLSSDARDGLGIPVMVVTLDPTQNKCFGNLFSRYFLEYLIGYDELLYASFKAVAQFEENKGFLRNLITWKHCTVMGKTHRDIASYIPSFFIMITITSLISLYMRYLNHQLILSFDYLLNHFNGEIGLLKFYACSMGFLGLVSLVWLYFKELDALFYIMFIVVTAEMYYAALAQCSITRKHWPKFFYLYLFVFYAYDYRFDGQYRPMSLACSWFFILHSMIYFYHHVELPSVLEHIEMQEHIIQLQLERLRQRQNRSARRQGLARNP